MVTRLLPDLKASQIYSEKSTCSLGSGPRGRWFTSTRPDQSRMQERPGFWAVFAVRTLSQRAPPTDGTCERRTPVAAGRVSRDRHSAHQLTTLDTNSCALPGGLGVPAAVALTVYDFSRGKRGPVLKARAGKTRITIRIDDDLPGRLEGAETVPADRSATAGLTAAACAGIGRTPVPGELSVTSRETRKCGILTGREEEATDR